MKHVMIDTETFALGAKPAIIQVGAVIFDPCAVLPNDAPKAEWTVSLQSSLLLAGSDYDEGTRQWWSRQSDEAKRSVCGVALPIDEVLMQLGRFILNECGGLPLGVWAHGAAADVPWLESAYRALGLKVPWSYRQVKDTRTLFWLAKAVGWLPVPREGVAHTALQDAIWQARDVVHALVAVKSTGAWPADLDAAEEAGG
jgi:hypothetical protein